MIYLIKHEIVQNNFSNSTVSDEELQDAKRTVPHSQWTSGKCQLPYFCDCFVLVGGGLFKIR